MFCPKCGAGEQKGNAYCTRCGEWLPELKSLRRDSPQQLLTFINFINGFSLLLSLAASALLFTAILSSRGQAQWPVVVANVLCIMIFSWQLAGLIMGLILAKRLRRGREGAAGTGRPDAGANYLPDAARFEAQAREVRSITENTTELFEPAQRSRVREL
jgi:hypothetical protein